VTFKTKNAKRQLASATLCFLFALLSNFSRYYCIDVLLRNYLQSNNQTSMLINRLHVSINGCTHTADDINRTILILITQQLMCLKFKTIINKKCSPHMQMFVVQYLHKIIYI